MEDNRTKVVVVDDNEINLVVTGNAVSDEHDVFTAMSGKELFCLLENIAPDLILLDIDMPEMDGYEVIKILKQEKRTADIPVVFLTSHLDPESEVKGLNLGAIDYITKPFSRELLNKRIDMHILIESQRKALQDYNQNLEIMVDRKTQTVFGMQSLILKTVADLVESRDNITGGHIERTQSYLNFFITLLLEHGIYVDEISKWDINLFVLSSQLHDVGKISTRDGILMKPGKLSVAEFEEMKKHTTRGVSIIERIEANAPENAFLKHARILAGNHHEKWSGGGYPYGLSGDDIPLQGRLMAIVDVYDALTNVRPYKKAFSHEASIEIMKKRRGIDFDPQLCDVFMKHEKDFVAIAKGLVDGHYLYL